MLFRSDDPATQIAVVSDRYKVVQPRTVLEFFRDLCATNAWKLETAGVLGGGAKYWALARTTLEDGVNGDAHQVYVLLATSADGSMATIARPTATRVVCQNTLTMALSSSDGKAVKVPHSTLFNPDAVRAQLGLVDLDASWETFRKRMQALAETEVAPAVASAYFAELLRPTGVSPVQRAAAAAEGDETFAALLGKPIGQAAAAPTSTRAIRGLADLERSYTQAPGAVPGTAYGLLQGVTHWVDHARGRDAEGRIQSALFGQGQALKDRALALAETVSADLQAAAYSRVVEPCVS